MHAEPQYRPWHENPAAARLTWQEFTQPLRNILRLRTLSRRHRGDPTPQDSGEYPVVARLLPPLGNHAEPGLGRRCASAALRAIGGFLVFPVSPALLSFLSGVAPRFFPGLLALGIGAWCMATKWSADEAGVRHSSASFGTWMLIAGAGYLAGLGIAAL